MAEKVVKVGLKRQSGYLYYIDKQGDISRAKMARGGKRKKKKTTKKKTAKKRTTKSKTKKRSAAKKRRR